MDRFEIKYVPGEPEPYSVVDNTSGEIVANCLNKYWADIVRDSLVHAHDSGRI